MKLFQGIAHSVIIARIDRVESTEYHWGSLPVPWKRIPRRVFRIRDCVADLRVLDIFNACSDKSYLTGFKFLDYMHRRSKHADFSHFKDFSSGHHFHLRTFGNPTLDNPDVGNSAFISVKFGVENQSLQRRQIFSFWRRNREHNPFENLLYSDSCLS